jgi:tetratricopeptide (TPR) repeat protein
MGGWLRRRRDAGATRGDGPAGAPDLDSLLPRDPTGLTQPVLVLASVLAPDGHPALLWHETLVGNYLGRHAAPEDGARQPSFAPVDTVDACLDALLRAGVLRTTPDKGLGLHPEHAREVRRRADPALRDAAVRTAAKAVELAWPRDAAAERALTDRLLAQVDALLANDTGRVLWRPQPHLVLFKAGRTRYALGPTDAAAELWELIVRGCEQVVAPDSDDYAHFVLAALNNLAVCREQQGRQAEALELLEQVCAHRTRLAGGDHRETLTARGNLASAYARLGRLDQAEAELTEVLAGLRRVEGPDGPDSLALLGNLAALHRDAGRPEQALELELEVLAGRERVLGPGHPDTLSARFNLAQSYLDLGRTEEAIGVLEQVAADRDRLLGPNHPNTLLARAELSVALYTAGRTEEAVALLEQVVTGRARVLGPDHRDTLVARANLAAFHVRAGRRDAGVALMREVSADMARALGPDHPSSRNAAGALASWTA